MLKDDEGHQVTVTGTTSHVTSKFIMLLLHVHNFIHQFIILMITDIVDTHTSIWHGPVIWTYEVNTPWVDCCTPIKCAVWYQAFHGFNPCTHVVSAALPKRQNFWISLVSETLLRSRQSFDSLMANFMSRRHQHLLVFTIIFIQITLPIQRQGSQLFIIGLFHKVPNIVYCYIDERIQECWWSIALIETHYPQDPKRQSWG